MKVFLIIGITLISFTSSFAQDCEGIVRTCESLLKTNTGGKDFISDGQVYTAFLDREKAEFKTTFFGGTTYRITASAGSKENYMIFTIKDPEGNILFSNRNYKNSPYWDFNVKESLPVTIETEFDMDLKVSGCAVMMIGFRN